MSKANEPSKERGPQSGEFHLGEPGLPWGTQPLWRALKGSPAVLGGRREAAWRLLPPAVAVDDRHLGGRAVAGWVAYSWQPPRERQSQPPRGAGVANLARRLIAQERSRMRHSTPLLEYRDRREKGNMRAA